MQNHRFARLGWLLIAPIVLIALAGLEWWVTALRGGQISSTGVLTGAALMGVVVMSASFLNRFRAGWANVAAAAIMAVLELVMGVLLLVFLLTQVLPVLPFSITAQLMMDDTINDIVVFSFLGLALLVGARSWWRHAGQQARMAKAEVQAAQAQALLAQSELRVLHAQIEPHFLWNTLAHVQHLIRKNPPDAERMTGYLIRYLRTAVPQIRSDASTLKTEFELVEAYLELMKIRMGERLTVEVSLPAELAEQPFAPLLVQTLVENAIKHGVEPKVGQVRVQVRALREEGNPAGLVIEVQDNGVGLQAFPITRGTQMGLHSVRERLKLLYGTSAALSISEATDGGVICRMTLLISIVQI